MYQQQFWENLFTALKKSVSWSFMFSTLLKDNNTLFSRAHMTIPQVGQHISNTNYVFHLKLVYMNNCSSDKAK